MRFKVQEPLVDVQAIVELASSFGPIAINRAYCHWQYCGRYRDALLQSAIELIQLFPPEPSAKNGADIKLCLDATEDLARFPHLGTIIIVGGDSDFMPVSQKIKAAGRTLVGLGTRKSTNRQWAKSCHEFRYYENLAGEEEPEIPSAEQAPVAPPAPLDPAAEMMKRAIKLLAETKGDAWVNKGSISTASWKSRRASQTKLFDCGRTNPALVGGTLLGRQRVFHFQFYRPYTGCPVLHELSTALNRCATRICLHCLVSGSVGKSHLKNFV